MIWSPKWRANHVAEQMNTQYKITMSSEQWRGVKALVVASIQEAEAYAADQAARAVIRGLVAQMPAEAGLNLPFKGYSSFYAVSPKRWLSRNGHRIRTTFKVWST